MSEQLENRLLAAMEVQTEMMKRQVVAITRLAESNESLCAVILQVLGDERDEIDTTELGDMNPVYLSGKPRG